jgi:hypothetical protein
MACVAGRERVFCEVDCRADVSGLCLSCRCPVAVLPLSCRRLVAVLSSGGDLRGGRTEGKQALGPMQPKAVEHAEPKAAVQPNRRRRAPSALAKRRSGETCKHILALIRRPLCLSHSRPNRLHSITHIFCQCDVVSGPTECIQAVPHNPPQTPYAMHQSTCSNRTLEPDIHRCQSLIPQFTQRHTMPTSTLEKNTLCIRKKTVLAKVPGYSTAKAGEYRVYQPTTHPANKSPTQPSTD